MNILGVGPSEFFFILLLGLIVVGPERLVEFARFLGRSVARLMAWQQQSPEAQLVQHIRQEIEDEIKGLRNELISTRQQFHSNVQSLKQSMPSLSLDMSTTDAATTQNQNDSQQAKQPVPARGRSNRGRERSDDTATHMSSVAEPSQHHDSSNVSSEQYLKHLLEQEPVAAGVPAHMPSQTSLNGGSDTIGEASGAPIASSGYGAPYEESEAYAVHPISASDVAMLQQQIQALMMDVHALQEYLRTHGCIDSEWAPPSHTMHHGTKLS